MSLHAGQVTAWFALIISSNPTVDRGSSRKAMVIFYANVSAARAFENTHLTFYNFEERLRCYKEPFWKMAAAAPSDVWIRL